MKNARGFTLIEILMVMALIGILAAIAVPSYNNYVIRGKLVDASTQLASARIKLEQFFQDYRTYDGSQGGASPCQNNSSGYPQGFPPTKYFTFACTALTPFTYTVTATNNANQGMGNSGAYVYTIDSNNAKATTKFAGSTSSYSCWIMKQGDSC